MRRLIVVLCALALPSAAQASAIRVADHSGAHALTVAGRLAVTVVDSGDRDNPFALVRTSGRGRNRLGLFGGRNAEFPGLAATPAGRTYVTWGVPISGGASVKIAPADDLDDALPEVLATGPAHLAIRSGAAVLAHPDRDGNAALSTLPISGERRSQRPEPVTLSSSAPQRRHLPLAVGTAQQGTLVLDLVQDRDRTELRVLGPGAPRRAILSLPLLRHVPARMDVSGDRIAVGYIRSGRSYLATARAGDGAWSRRRLPGDGGEGAPAPMYVGGALRVAYTRRVRTPRVSQREVFLWSASRVRRLTRTAGDEREPLAAAAGPAAYVAWTRREKTGAKSAFVERVR